MIDEKKLIKNLKKEWEELADCSENLETLLDYVIKFIKEQPKIGEWIPCSERLPEECENVLVWYEYFRYGDYNCMFQTYGIGYHVEGHWRGDVNGAKARCIAWQPLPEPYHE